MKVVRIIARLNVGGPARHVAWLNAGLRRAGVECELVAGKVAPGEGDMGYFARAQGIEPIIIPEMSREISLKDALTIWKLYRLFVRLRPDIVHTHTAKAGTVGRVAGLLYRWLTPGALRGRPRRCRFAHTYHGHIFHSYYGAGKTRLFLLVEKLLARAATDRLVVISPQQYREIHEEFGVGRAAQFRIIPLGLDLEAFKDWAARRAPLRAELGADEAEVLVGIVGRLTEIKHHELFLAAAARYKQRSEVGSQRSVATGRRVRFVVIGDGHLRARLQAQARALELSADELVFLGERNDPENFYPALDIVALTSRNEGTPLTLIEAMANARPVIATAVGGVVDLLGAATADSVEHAARGWQICARGLAVRSGDAEGLSDGLARLVADEALRQELGERGRSFVAQHYAKERLLADMMKLYAELGEQQTVAARAESGLPPPAPQLGTARLKGD